MKVLPRPRAVSQASLAALALVCAVGGGCADEKKTQAENGDAGAQGPPKPVLDGKLAAAVQAAESARPAAPAKGDAEGPPENGVFAPGAANKALPPGAPAKLELLGDGKEPKVRLAPTLADEQKETVSVTLRRGGGAIPVEYGLVLKVDKPKDEKKTEGPKTYRVVGKVASVGLSPQLPRDASDLLGKLKGTELRYTVGPDGGLSDLAYATPKDADPGLGEAVIRGLLDAINVSMPLLPPKPIGVGAYWMLTDRTAASGVDVVRYRVYHVEKVDKDSASLSVDVRQYAVKDEADLGPGAPKLSIVHFDSTGKGKMDWTAAGLLPAHGETSTKTGIVGNIPGQQQQAMLQTEVSARFAVEQGDKKK